MFSDFFEGDFAGFSGVTGFGEADVEQCYMGAKRLTASPEIIERATTVSKNRFELLVQVIYGPKLFWWSKKKYFRIAIHRNGWLRDGQDCYGIPSVATAYGILQTIDIFEILGMSNKPYQECAKLRSAKTSARNEAMASAETVRGAWHPRTESERQFVRSQLEKIVSDERFTASKRYPGLLRYVVEQTLADNIDNLKERTLGVEVFRRPPDYDTNLDPVVRLCAGEVRKRLAQYYQSPGHGGELRIELNPGSYVPVFSPAAGESPSLDIIESDVPSKPEQISQFRRTINKNLPAVLVAFGVAIVVILVLGLRSRGHLVPHESRLEEVWSPLLASSKPILFCVGGIEMFEGQGFPLATQLQSVADDDSTLQAVTDRNDFVPFSDVQTLSGFLTLIGTHGHAFRVQNFRTTVSSQLREGPVVLLGALNNDWTLNRTSPLRFHVEGPEGPNKAYWIADREHPESRAWQVVAQAPRSNVVKDYAIAARFTDESTSQVVLVAAGIAGIGTRAAGEFLTDEASLKQLADSAGVDWRKTNFEVVLSSQVVNGMQGKPKVEAKTFW